LTFDRTRDGKNVGVVRPDEKKKMGKKVGGERMRRKEWKESRRCKDEKKRVKRK